jgi:hypothetical protein
VKRGIRYKNLENTSYNWAINGLGLSNFMSYAAHFCKDEGQNGAFEAISVGSGDGTVDNGIIEAYHDHFGEELEITLVDKNPKYDVHFRTVKDLIKKRPSVVGNCILLIIWPEFDGKNDGYDIDAVRELQPLAALALYETTGVSGGVYFQIFVGNKSTKDYRRRWAPLDDEDLGLENYAVEEVAYQRANLIAGEEYQFGNITWIQEPGMRAYCFRMVKLKRIGDLNRPKKSAADQEGQ